MSIYIYTFGMAPSRDNSDHQDDITCLGLGIPNLTFTFHCYREVAICKTYMGVSKNNGTPKSSILIGFSIINHPFWGTPFVGNTHMITYFYSKAINPMIFAGGIFGETVWDLGVHRRPLPEATSRPPSSVFDSQNT